MKQLKKLYLQLFLLICLAINIVSISPVMALSHTQPTTAPMISFDDCAADNFAPQSKLVYVGNSYTRIFHHASCQYTRLIPEKHRVYFDTRIEAVKTKYVPCKVCRP